MKHDLTAEPACYTRPYPTTWDQVVDNWKNGRDFKIFKGPYYSIRDLETLKQTYRGLIVYYRDDQGNNQTGYITLEET